ncbi:MAG: energy-coupling factor ABC transporter ATP-binding protein [Gemmatimonadales bacterium]
MTRLALEHVTYHYPATAAPALADVSLDLHGGEVVGVVGCAGAGASTLLLVAAGLAPRVLGGTLSGAVRGAGRSAILLPTPWTQVSGMAVTVWQEVAFGPANLGWAPERISMSVDRALTRVDVAQLRDRDPATLSGGELQRVLLAGILAMEPELLLLDEPTAELDAAGAHLVWDLLRALAREGNAVVVATSDLDALPVAADRVVWLAGGRVRAAGPARSLLGDAALWSDEGPGSTSVAGAWRLAGLPAPLPLTVADVTARVP